MGTVSLNSNIESQRARRRLDEADDALARSLTRLSSGMRINRSADDAAGLAVAMSLDSQSRVFSQATRNGNDGLSLLNIVDGALENLSNITQRQMELAQQAANGTLSPRQRLALQREATALTKEYNRTLQSTTFNGSQLTQYGLNPLTLQLGYGSNGGITFNRNYDLSRISGGGQLTSQGVTSVAGSSGTILSIDWDGDGNQDILSSTGAVYTGDGTGFIEESDSFTGIMLDKADMNGDGREDLIVRGTGGTMGVYLSVGASGRQYVSSSVPNSDRFKVGDFNADGIPDIGLWTGGAGNFLIGIGSKSGTFTTSPTPALAGAPAGLSQVADFNGDGRSDFIIAGSNSINLAINNGNGTFTLQTTATSAFDYFSVVDFDNDGTSDVVVNNSSSYVSYSNNGGGSFTQAASGAISGTEGTPGQIRDVNGDGLADILMLGTSTYRAIINNGNGTFSNHTQGNFSLGSQGSLISADMDNDGISDFISMNYTGSAILEINVLTQSTTRTTDAQYFSLTSQADARSALSLLQSQLNRISTERGKVGSIQSRVNAAINSVTATSENLKSARSRIVDADIALESANMTRTSILRQSATSVLAQANQAPAIALRLLTL